MTKRLNTVFPDIAIVRISFNSRSQKIESPFSPKCGASQSDATGVSARIPQGFLKSKRSERDARRGFEPVREIDRLVKNLAEHEKQRLEEIRRKYAVK